MNGTKFRPEYCQALIDHMAKGYSIGTFGFTVGVSKGCVDAWLKKFPAFADAFELGTQARQYLFEGFAKAASSGETKASTALIYSLQNYFPEYYKKEDRGNGATVIMIDTGIDRGQIVETTARLVSPNPDDGF